MKIKLGTRLKLKAMPENDVAEEEGILVFLSFDPTPVDSIDLDLDNPNQMLLVRVDDEYLENEQDDGLRECSVDQVEWPAQIPGSDTQIPEDPTDMLEQYGLDMAAAARRGARLGFMATADGPREILRKMEASVPGLRAVLDDFDRSSRRHARLAQVPDPRIGNR